MGGLVKGREKNNASSTLAGKKVIATKHETITPSVTRTTETARSVRSHEKDHVGVTKGSKNNDFDDNSNDNDFDYDDLSATADVNTATNKANNNTSTGGIGVSNQKSSQPQNKGNFGQPRGGALPGSTTGFSIPKASDGGGGLGSIFDIAKGASGSVSNTYIGNKSVSITPPPPPVDTDFDDYEEVIDHTHSSVRDDRSGRSGSDGGGRWGKDRDKDVKSAMSGKSNESAGSVSTSATARMVEKYNEDDDDDEHASTAVNNDNKDLDTEPPEPVSVGGGFMPSFYEPGRSRVKRNIGGAWAWSGGISIRVER